MPRPESWLEPSDAEKARQMEETIGKKFKEGEDAAPYTPHGPEHFDRVEAWIRELIPRHAWPKLTPDERQILTWCAWTHDIGMFKSLHPPSISDADIRRLHVDLACEWVASNYASLCLEPIEAQVVAEIDKYHSRQHPIGECKETRVYRRGVVRSRLLAAYLRLADALELGHSRVAAGEHHHRFDLLTTQISDRRDDTLFHWIKSFVVAGISVNHDRHEIRVEFLKDDKLVASKFDHIKRYVINEIEDELATVEDILNSGEITSFHRVLETETKVVKGSSQHRIAIPTEQALDYVQMVQSPNATAVTRAALDAVAALAARVPDANLDALVGDLEILKKSVDGQLRKRRCHNELRWVKMFLEELTKKARSEGIEPKVFAAVLDKFNSKFRDLIKRGDRKIFDYFEKRTFRLAVKGPPPDRPLWFLLYGASVTVANLLTQLSNKKHRIGLWIAEGRPKAQHGAYDKTLYRDCDRYLEILGDCGFTGHEIRIIPDATIATVCSQSQQNLKYRVDAVIFGTNGINVTPPAIVHSAGHLSVAIAANTYDIPVFALGSSAKIWSDTVDERDSEPRRAWLTSDEREFTKRHRKVGKVDLEWNPREDSVPLTLLSYLITDQGCIEGGKDTAVQLREWEKSVRKRLLNSSFAQGSTRRSGAARKSKAPGKRRPSRRKTK